MTIRVLCERCGKSYDFKKEHIGKRFRCKICDKVLEVRDMISEFENIESQSSEILPPPIQTEKPGTKSKSITKEEEEIQEEDEQVEVEIVQRKNKKSGKRKKDEKDQEGWQERLQVKSNSYETPMQYLIRLMIKNIYMVIFTILGAIGAIALVIYLLFV
jgi:hypothetical protein